MEPQRLFIAIRIPPQASNQLAATADHLARRAQTNRIDVRWVEPMNYHITLAYLGYAREHAAEAVASVIDSVCDEVAPFECRLSGLGGFANNDKASVIWAGVSDATGSFAKLAHELQRKGRDLGFAIPEAEFVPHVTLGRVDQVSISELILPWREQMFSVCMLGSIELLDSQAKSGSYVYKTVTKKALRSADLAAKTAIRSQSDPLQLEPETDDGWAKGDARSEPHHI